MASRTPDSPHGSPSIFSGASETFSFHASPESFIMSRVLALRSQNPDIIDSRAAVRAKVLNRNVAVISSYHHVKQLLFGHDSLRKLSSSKAYDELIAPFFPPPNLLLLDTPSHQPAKDAWHSQLDGLPQKACCNVQTIVISHFMKIRSGSTIDLYENMKALAWELILRIFLSRDDEDTGNQSVRQKVCALQETLLRGQFSLFPVSVNTRWWKSSRAKGIEARLELQNLLKDHVEGSMSKCPFMTSTDDEKHDVASHLLLFTSSLAAKALASLLTALLLNLFVTHHEQDDAMPLAELIKKFTHPDKQDHFIRSIMKETERLSPPIVGIMRRTTEDVILSNHEQSTRETLIPKDWDTWLYFVGAARDPAVFGPTAEIFQADRYRTHAPSQLEGFAFGAGPKTCLGQELMRNVCTQVIKILLGLGQLDTSQSVPSNITLHCYKRDLPLGVQGWLGLSPGIKPEDWARDMKQLPTQRPTKPVKVTITHVSDT